MGALNLDGAPWNRIDADGPCWVWQGPINNKYGRFSRYGKHWYVHRYVWTVLAGPIPDDMEIDHLCLNKLCCNPDHLEVVTKAENRRRAARQKAYCKRGHRLAGDNVYPWDDNRRCRVCFKWRERNRRRAETGNLPPLPEPVRVGEYPYSHAKEKWQ